MYEITDKTALNSYKLEWCRHFYARYIKRNLLVSEWSFNIFCRIGQNCMSPWKFYKATLQWRSPLKLKIILPLQLFLGGAFQLDLSGTLRIRAQTAAIAALLSPKRLLFRYTYLRFCTLQLATGPCVGTALIRKRLSKQGVPKGRPSLQTRRHCRSWTAP